MKNQNIDPEARYVYRWGNNSVRAGLKGRECRIIARGAYNSAMIEFMDNGERHNVSRYALLRVDMPKISRRTRCISDSVGFPDKRGDRQTGAKSGVPGPIPVRFREAIEGVAW